MTERDQVVVGLTLKGYAEFERDLRKLNKDYVRILRKEIREAAQPIRDDARARYRRKHPRGRRRARTKKSDIAVVHRNRFGDVSVVMNKRGEAPWLIGQEFGADRRRLDAAGRPLTRFPQWRPSRFGVGSASNFFWEAGYQGREEASKKIVSAIDRANRRAFPDP